MNSRRDQDQMSIAYWEDNERDPNGGAHPVSGIRNFPQGV